MNSRRILSCIAVACLTAVGLAVLVMIPRDGHGVTKANFNRIKLGMSLKNVEAIFGRPSDGLMVCDPKRPRWHEDYGGDDWCWIILDENGVVTEKVWSPGTSSLIERTTRRLQAILK
jgi:hypothetical protein